MGEGSSPCLNDVVLPAPSLRSLEGGQGSFAHHARIAGSCCPPKDPCGAFFLRQVLDGESTAQFRSENSLQGRGSERKPVGPRASFEPGYVNLVTAPVD